MRNDARNMCRAALLFSAPLWAALLANCTSADVKQRGGEVTPAWELTTSGGTLSEEQFCAALAAAPQGGVCGNAPPLTAAQLADVPRIACTDRPARVNGCGPNPGSPNAIRINALLNAPPLNVLSALFMPACNAHDGCWGQCYDGTNDKADKKACDSAFKTGMMNICNGFPRLALRVSCKSAALAFYGAVAIGGGGAWKSAQAYHCAAKPPPRQDAGNCPDGGSDAGNDAGNGNDSGVPFGSDLPDPISMEDTWLCVSDTTGALSSDDGLVDLSSCGGSTAPCLNGGPPTLSALDSCLDAVDPDTALSN